MQDQYVGQTLGKWRLEVPIGAGGMGEVYLASRNDGEVRHSAAIKMLRRSDRSQASLESAALSSIHHHHIVRLIGEGIAPDGRDYLVMEYVDGLPITDYADQIGLTIDERIHLFTDACNAVSAIHQAGWMHLDLKPANILVNREGVLKIVDFGVSRQTTLPCEMAAAFSGPYASPEQVQGDTPTRAIDLYALGAVLYELLSGHPPFEPHLADAELQRRIRCETPIAPSIACGMPRLVRNAAGKARELGPERLAAMRGGLHPSELQRKLRRDPDAICLFALRKEPGRRYDDAIDMWTDLQNVLAGRKPAYARSGDPFYSGLRAARRRPLILAGVMFAVSGTFAGWILPKSFRAALTSSADTCRKANSVADIVSRQLQQELRPALAAQPELHNSEGVVDEVVKSAGPAAPAKTPWEDLHDQLGDAIRVLSHPEQLIEQTPANNR